MATIVDHTADVKQETLKEAIQQMMAAFEQFQNTMQSIRTEQKEIIAALRKHADEQKIQQLKHILQDLP